MLVKHSGEEAALKNEKTPGCQKAPSIAAFSCVAMNRLVCGLSLCVEVFDIVRKRYLIGILVVSKSTCQQKRVV